jgi:hypothetical protein
MTLKPTNAHGCKKVYYAHRIYGGAFCNSSPRRWLQEWPKHVGNSLYPFFLWRFDPIPGYDLRLHSFAVALI